MNKHNQTDIFYPQKWDMQLGYSSHFPEKNVHKKFTGHSDESITRKNLTNNQSQTMLPFTRTQTKQSWLKAVLLRMSSRQKIKKKQTECIQDKFFPLQDVQHVVERMMQDLKQITDQQDIRATYRITDAQIARYCHDIKILAEGGYLQCVDISLLDNDRKREHRIEYKAFRFEMNIAGEKLATNRPNSIFVSHNDKTQPALRIVLKYNMNYTRDAQIDLEAQLFADWKAAYCDIAHSPLYSDIDRDYSCDGFRIQRKVFC